MAWVEDDLKDFVTDHKLCLWCINNSAYFILFTNWTFQIALSYVCCWFCLTSSVRWQKESLPFDATAVCIVWSTQQSFLVSHLYWIFVIYLMLWLNYVSLKKLLKWHLKLGKLFLAHYVTEKTQNYSKTLFFTFQSLCWLLSLLLFVQPLKFRPAQKTKYHLLPASFAFLLPLH